MQNIENSAYTNSQQFGMTEDDIKNYKLKSFFGRIKYYFSLIEPTLVRTFNTLIYWSVKIGKSFISSIIRMILGKEV